MMPRRIYLTRDSIAQKLFLKKDTVVKCLNSIDPETRFIARKWLDQLEKYLNLDEDVPNQEVLQEMFRLNESLNYSICMDKKVSRRVNMN